jgi:excisionase family DNA binding protein
MKLREPPVGNQDTAGREGAIVRLGPDQLRGVVRAIVVAVVEGLRGDVRGCGRSAFTVAEVAKRAHVGESTVRRDIASGVLRVTRPGGRDQVRVMVEDERAWLEGRIAAEDKPITGVSPKVARRNQIRSIAAHVVHPRGRSTVHKL